MTYAGARCLSTSTTLPRTSSVAINWSMVMGQRDIGRGRLTLVMMMNSAEPATLAKGGSPQLFQTGEASVFHGAEPDEPHPPTKAEATVPVRAATVGYLRDLVVLRDVKVLAPMHLGLGADVTLYGVPSEIKACTATRRCRYTLSCEHGGAGLTEPGTGDTIEAVSRPRIWSAAVG